ncbi:MAG: GNAT family N-acetyltransferase [Pseudomonadota bacterium]
MFLGADERPLDKLKENKRAERFEFVTPNRSDLSEISTLFYESVQEASSPSKVLEILEHNSDALLAFKNKSTGRMGVVAILPLNDAGYIALADNRLDTVSPDKKYLCKLGQTPSAIYIWGVGITPYVTAGLGLVMQKLEKPPYVGKPLYAKAANQKSFKFLLNLGFTQGAHIHGFWQPEIFQYVRDSQGLQKTKKDTPSYDSFNPNANSPKKIGIKVVHTSEELSQVFMIRGAAYLGEQGVPWSEDVDGNDYCSAHLIGYVGREPAACLRMRFFANFSKIERLAVLPRFRDTSIAVRIVKAGVDYGKAKGYRRFYGHTAIETGAIWKRFGFAARTMEPIRYKTDQVYFEGDMITRPDHLAISPKTEPYIILRPEGQWHRKGPIEGDKVE